MNVEEFLAHYGVPGMRWGVRRNRDSGSGSSASLKKKGKVVDDDDESVTKNDDGSYTLKGRQYSKDPVGAIRPMSTTDGGDSKVLMKRADGKWEETRMSADAERLIKTHQKAGHEMSDREMREAINRAKMVKEYDDIFNQDARYQQMKSKVDTFRLEQEYSKIQAELNPSRLQRVKTLADQANSAYSSYQKLDKATGGFLSKQLKTALPVTTTSASAFKAGGAFKVNPSKVKISPTKP